MRETFLKTIITLLLCFCFDKTKSDIPTHCLNHQMLGRWIFYYTEPTTKTLAQLYDHKCGINDHTDANTINQFNMNLNLFKKSIEVSFYEDHSTVLEVASQDFNTSQVKIFNSLDIFTVL